MIPLKGLTCFEDIEFEIEKPMLKRKVTFQQIKDRPLQVEKFPDQLFQIE